ncbi:MAG: hypothetical protein IKC59_00865, partial [Clostridia bacterium]|nr:hypothetical protein [Clostridia bacterium]
EAAVAAAHEKKLPLKLPKGEYKILRTLVLDGIDVYCEDVKISFYGLTQNVPGVDVWNNVNIYGKLHIWTVDNQRGNHGGRCGMGFGDYGTGRGAHNCYVQELELSGGVPNANGVLITGDSSNITFDKVVIPEGTNICRGILAHWGNAAQYVVKNPQKRSDGIFPVEGADYTKHPHDIHVGSLICRSIDEKGEWEDSAAFFVSAAYNVTVDEIFTNGGKTVVAISGGDCGLNYASPEIQQHGLKNLVFKKVTAKNIRGCAICYSVISSYLGNTKFVGTLELGEINIEGAAENTGSCLACYGVKKLRVKTLNLKNRNQQGVFLICHATDCEIETINMSNCKGPALRVLRYQDEPACENIRIGTVNIDANCGSQDADVFLLESVDGIKIDRVNLNNATYRSVISLGSDCKNVHLEALCAEGKQPASLIYAREAINAGQGITIGDVSFPTNE